MKRTEFTYGQLDRVLRSLGFSCHISTTEPPARVYQHASGATVLVPPFPDNDKVLDYHLLATRLELDNFGIATPPAFTAELQKAS